MDSIVNYTNQNENIEFLVSLDYSLEAFSDYECLEWGNLYEDLGIYDNNPLIINGDTDFDSDGYYDHHIWNLFAGSTYSSYAMIDHHMVVRHLFDEPDYHTFVNLYLPQLVGTMYGCIDQSAVNYNSSAVYENNSCIYLGDVNQDNFVDVNDIIILIQMILESEISIYADINNDQNIDILDIIALINIILNQRN